MQSLASSNRVLDAIDQKLKILARHPEMGQLRHERNSAIVMVRQGVVRCPLTLR